MERKTIGRPKKNTDPLLRLANDLLLNTKKEGVHLIEIHSMELESVNLTGSYRYTSHTDSDGKVVPVDYNMCLLQNPLSVIEGEEVLRERSKDILRKKIRRGLPWKFYVDLSKPEGKLLFFFLSRHPMITSDSFDNPSAVQPLLKLVLRTEQNAYNYKQLLAKKEAINIIFSLSYEQLKELIYYLGNKPFVSPKVLMTQIECICFLIGEEFDGVLFKKLHLFDVFYKGIDSDNKSYRVNINKALDYRLITKENGVYLSFSGTSLGKEESEIFSYYENKPSHYVTLCEEISKKESAVPPSTVELHDVPVQEVVEE